MNIIYFEINQKLNRNSLTDLHFDMEIKNNKILFNPKI